jgi:hypothetical protein
VFGRLGTVHAAHQRRPVIRVVRVVPVTRVIRFALVISVNGVIRFARVIPVVSVIAVDLRDGRNPPGPALSSSVHQASVTRFCLPHAPAVRPRVVGAVRCF